ncbi:hypothetical protein PYCCODRAFT_1472748 [Trametes coccinea BRFM310]|uniref:Uncharacterized protein n=1 Tax=Trametes coccinea (strain BRFM310) TaxID=1353009 RepID=A0A1Y2I773_TRAC3|nr:hypothetical protein PYCCODRAFT_1472748 [Trametes coccinea BRFM310]
MHLRFVSAGEATTGGFFHTASTGNTGNGTNSNTFSYVDLGGNTAARLYPAKRSPSPVFGPQTPLVMAELRLPGGRKIGN